MVEELLGQGFSPWLVRLIVGQYQMGGRLWVAPCLPQRLSPERSAVVGCGWANAMTEGATYGLLELWRNQLPTSQAIRAEQ